MLPQQCEPPIKARGCSVNRIVGSLGLLLLTKTQKKLWEVTTSGVRKSGRNLSWPPMRAFSVRLEI